MKKAFQYISLGLVLLFVIPGYAQKEVKGYYIEGDEIVFTFNRSDYEQATHDNYGEKLDFEDLDIRNVVVAGSFNDWSREHWKMRKIADGTYQLRKKISDFSDEFTWEFKFVINNTYWAEPDNETSNFSPARNRSGSSLNSYNLKVYTAVPTENGNAKFFLKGYENAEEVILAGDFSRWDENFLKMKRTTTGWELNLDLRPGVYQYKFIVDGDWIEDPSNNEKVRNEFDGFNSVMRIKKKVTFHLNNFQDASEVILTGSFNNWDEHQLRMKKTDSGWIQTMVLSGGKHHYKYIVDGEWKVDPDNTIMEYDGEGHINSVCMVK
ncbi:hypothetical protein [Christiangramia echinicola]|uniref:hypothetical protein n=1 Tax=Christiangramia echinicola TaxID=279359 RepID=UPI0004000C22|nr:hypothetical protein [Christiangramia echinicola]